MLKEITFWRYPDKLLCKTFRGFSLNFGIYLYRPLKYMIYVSKGSVDGLDMEICTPGLPRPAPPRPAHL